eukprot:g1051.t1
MTTTISSKTSEEAKGDESFLSGLMPNEETQADAFKRAYPECDGRSVVVAVFDTGCDPAAAGLQTTSDGRPKIVDIVDATGSGDVNMDRVVKGKPSEDGSCIEIEGMSGRTLRLPADAKSSDGAYRLGLKRAFDLFPKALLKRIKSERRREFEKKHARILSEAEDALIDFDRNGKKEDDGDDDAKKDGGASKNDEEEEERTKKKKTRSAERKELEARVANLKKMMSAYEDPGPSFDCVTYHDGQAWMAFVDTSGKGDLREARPMTNYRSRRQYARCDDASLASYCVNIYDEGRLLSIVADVGSHGTHVASIIGAYDASRPELRGVAPGCQIVSVRIGDRRVQGSMETALGMVRAVEAVKANKCDIVNMSYGEPTVSASTRTAVLRAFREMVERHEVIFVTSAGNSGPALSTLGAPCEPLSDIVVGVGAYVSKSMMGAQYSLIENVPQTAFTWSSTGPSRNGHWGVALMAPGAAIADVPAWTLKFKQQMNGTSMASPNAAGVFALVLSALKRSKIPHGVPRVVRAALNAARTVKGVVAPAQGQGLIQAIGTFEHVRDHAENETFGLRLRVSVGGGKGIYLRDAHTTRGLQRRQAFVTVAMPEDASKSRHLSPSVSGWSVRLSTTRRWISCPRHFHVANHRGFEIRVDADALEPGHAHCGEVLGFDIAAPASAGPLFRVPVTVTKPRPPAPSIDLDLVRMDVPGEVHRRFVEVPAGATWAEVHLAAGEHWGGGGSDANSRVIVVAAQQLRKQTAFRDTSVEKWLRLGPESEHVATVPVDAGATLEIAIAQFWSSPGASSVRARVEFRGVEAPRSICVSSTAHFSRVDLRATLRDASVGPTAKLSEWHTLHRPKAGAKVTSPPRDRLDGRGDAGRSKSLTLTYEFVAYGKTATKASMQFAAPLCELLYDCPFESQMVTVRDANGKIVHASDAWPKNYVATLEPGRYVASVEVRHDDASALEALLKREPTLTVRRVASGAPSVPIFRTLADAALGKSWSGGPTKLSKGASMPLFFGLPDAAAVRKSLGDAFGVVDATVAGHSLVGHATFLKRPQSSGGGASPIKCRLEVTMGGGWNAASKTTTTTKKKKSDDTPSLEDRLRDARIAHLESLAKAKKDRSTEYESLLEETLSQHPTHVPLLVAAMRHRASRWRDARKDVKAREDALSAADRVARAIDASELSKHFGVPNPPAEPSAAEKREARRMKDLKSQLLEALALKCAVLADDEEDAAFDAALSALRRWADLKSASFALLLANRALAKGRRGTELKHLSEVEATPKRTGADQSDVAIRRRQIACYEALRWGAWAELARARFLVDFPKEKQV